MSTCPVEATYFDVNKLLDDITWRWIKNHGGNFEELRAEANFQFLLIYNDYDQRKGSFSARLGFILAYRFFDLHRKQQRKKNIQFKPLRDKNHIAKEERGVFKFFPDLSDDAQTVVSLVFHPNKVVKKLAQAGLGTRNPNSMTYAIRCYLTDCGWSTKRIYNCFSEISEALLPY